MYLGQFELTSRSSKRSQSTVLEDDDTIKVVSSDMQTFLAKKLAEHLDRYDVKSYNVVSRCHETRTALYLNQGCRQGSSSI